MNICTAPAAPVKPNVKLELTHEEATKLRRVMYYNKTVAGRFSENAKGGSRKAADIDAFMSQLGSSLKAQGIDRF